MAGEVSRATDPAGAAITPCIVSIPAECSPGHGTRRPGARPVPASLGALLGTARAGVRVRLGSPLSTSQLVAVTGQGLGSVGRHLRVLLDAGLVERRRAGTGPTPAGASIRA